MAEGGQDQGTEALWQRYGFESEAAMEEAWKSLKDDHKQTKAKAREGAAALARLEELERVQKDREEREKTEAQKLADKLAALEKQMSERDALIARKDRELLTERVLATRLSGKSAEHAAVLRRLYASELTGKDYADERELVDLLNPVDKDFETFTKTLGNGQAGAGPGLGVRGAAPSGQQPTRDAAASSFMKLSLPEMLASIRAGKKA